MDFISDLCDPVIVMAEGHVLAQGKAKDIMENEEVIEAYLGTGLKNKPGVSSAHLMPPKPAKRKAATARKTAEKPARSRARPRPKPPQKPRRFWR